MIKKKSGWSEYYPPTKPIAPKKPTEVLEHRQQFYVLQGASILNLDSVKLPDSIELKDLIIEAMPGYEDDDHCFDVYYFLKENSSNPDYDKQLKIYNKRYEEYKLAKSNYKEEKKLWKQWKEEKEKENIEKRLKIAANLLAKSGKRLCPSCGGLTRDTTAGCDNCDFEGK